MSVELNELIRSVYFDKHIQTDGLFEESAVTDLPQKGQKRSSLRYFLGVSERTEISLPISLPREIANQLAERGICVLFGAPASGKTEQMELAIPPSQLEEFDLFDRFCTAYSSKTGRPKDEIVRDYLSQTEAQIKLKEAQKEWLRNERDSIFNELASSPKQVILFDEFDFCAGFVLSPAEADAAVSIVEIGKRLKNAGKQIVFIIHGTGDSCPLFWEAMDQSFGYGQNQSARTQFFTREEEIYLLSETNLSLEEKQEFMAFAKGSPTAYLPILQRKQEITLDLLKEQALIMSTIVIKYTRQTLTPEVWDILFSVASGEGCLECIEDPILINQLLASSFVGQIDGSLIMPDFAKDAIFA